jgi:hypothetical protein
LLESLPKAKPPPSEDEAKDANIDGSTEIRGDLKPPLAITF